MRPYLLAESNWKSVKEQEVDLVIQPWGATEAHNFHLPYGADVIESDFIAAEAARLAREQGAKLIVLPTIPYGVNTGQTDIKLDMNLNPTTLLKILDDILSTLNRQGIKKFLIMNSHGGNDFKWMLRELGLKYPEMFLSSCNWFTALDKSEFFEHAGDHADEMETSVLMYLVPHLVLPLAEAGDGKDKKIKISGFREGWAWTERKWSKVTADTGIGFPKAASAEKGERFFRAITEKIAELFVDISKSDINKLYE